MLRSGLTVIFWFACALPTGADDWPEFLGPGGQARSSETVPTTWNESQHLLWKVDMPGTASSSPIVVGDRAIVTCYVDKGGPAARQVLSFDKRTGQQEWVVEFPIDYREDAFQGYLTEHGYASNTPVVDGG